MSFVCTLEIGYIHSKAFPAPVKINSSIARVVEAGQSVGDSVSECLWYMSITSYGDFLYTDFIGRFDEFLYGEEFTNTMSHAGSIDLITNPKVSERLYCI